MMAFPLGGGHLLSARRGTGASDINMPVSKYEQVSDTVGVDLDWALRMSEMAPHVELSPRSGGSARPRALIY